MTTHEEDFILPYVKDLRNVVEMEAIRAARITLAADPLGGASQPYWEPISAMFSLNIKVTDPVIDPTFSFMTVDHDGEIRMDCSSPYAMARLVNLRDQYHLAFGNEPDADRHGIVTPTAGLLNPNHYLSVAIRYLLAHRPLWSAGAAVGKTMVSSSIIDHVVKKLNRRLSEVPVGFKWFTKGLFDGSYCFGGEESAGASFLQSRLQRAPAKIPANTSAKSLKSLVFPTIHALMRQPHRSKKRSCRNFLQEMSTRRSLPASRSSKSSPAHQATRLLSEA